MHRFAAAIANCLLWLMLAPVARGENAIDWSRWRALPVQTGGRQQSLDSFARETLREITQSGSLTDPMTFQLLDPTAAYVSMLLDWRGWEHADRGHLELVTDWHPLYFHLHEADRWDRAPLLGIESRELQSVLGLGKGVNRISPYQLASTTIEDRRTDRRLPFPTWAQNLVAMEQAGEVLTEPEQSAVELARRLWLYQDHRMGRELKILPLSTSDGANWHSVAELLLARHDAVPELHSERQRWRDLLLQVSKSFREQDTAAFSRASDELLANFQRIGAQEPGYASRWAMGLELLYHHWAPFRWGWALLLTAAAGIWLHAALRWHTVYRGSLAAYFAGLTAMAIGLGLRIVIAGRPPVTSMYESVICVAAGVAVLGLVLERFSAKPLLLAAAATVSAVLLALADGCQLVLDPAVRPLEPILGNNVWLVAHVVTTTLSFAALALALGIANITLGHYLLGRDNPRAVRSLSRWTYLSLLVGVVLLAAGIVLGAIWADSAWGRFWGWERKEVWALVALLSSGAVLHARQAGWAGHRGLAVGAVACFCLMVMAWYGVNFTVSTGLHHYGWGRGGQTYVLAAVAVQVLYVGAALLRSWHSDAERGSAWKPAAAWPR